MVGWWCRCRWRMRSTSGGLLITACPRPHMEPSLLSGTACPPASAPPCAGRDLFSALQISGRGPRSSRVFGWWRQGARVALEIARAINHCHYKVGRWRGWARGCAAQIGLQSARRGAQLAARGAQPAASTLQTCCWPHPCPGLCAWRHQELQCAAVRQWHCQAGRRSVQPAHRAAAARA